MSSVETSLWSQKKASRGRLCSFPKAFEDGSMTRYGSWLPHSVKVGTSTQEYIHPRRWENERKTTHDVLASFVGHRTGMSCCTLGNSWMTRERRFTHSIVLFSLMVSHRVLYRHGTRDFMVETYCVRLEWHTRQTLGESPSGNWESPRVVGPHMCSLKD